jgi:glutamine amidotransferase
MKIAVIDYGSGNLRSAAKAFEKAAGGAATVTITGDADVVRKADRIVLPGQGAFADCMKGLSSVTGMLDVLNEVVVKGGKPFFGICVGMQLLAETGFEHGTHQGLGWLKGKVAPLEVKDASLKIPHMGWNTLQLDQPEHPLLKELPANPFVYFVHSYALFPADATANLASCDYGGRFTAAVVHNNIAGTQFHPEKSQKTGLQLIRNFLDWRP